MTYPILSTKISATTLVPLRDRTRQVGEIFGLGKLEVTRFVTAVSEIARNAVQFAESGTVAFSFKEAEANAPQSIIATVSDKGPGIADVAGVLAGRPSATSKAPMGVVGARRLSDVLTIESTPGAGTVVSLEMHLPKFAPRLTAAELGLRADELARQKPNSPLQELERQNREMLEALQELRERQFELQRADERKNQFLITLAHELRNPLGTLHMNLEIMRRNLDIKPEDLAKRREAMARQTELMNKMVEDLVDVSRVSQGKVELVKLPVELNELVAQAAEMCEAAIYAKSHAFALAQAPGEVWIEGDARRLKQVVANLIQNSTRYTPKGGSIKASVSISDDRALVQIEDNGMGIAPDILPQVFDLFVQGDGPSTHTPGGLGIGLTLVKRLVESHGGFVSANSAGPGHGCTFILSFPLPAKAA